MEVSQIERQIGESDLLSRCSKECRGCAAACHLATRHCLESGGDYVSRDLMTALQDCAEACHLNSDFIARGSGWYAGTSGLCSDICDVCRGYCEEFPEDGIMEACARSCKACAEICTRVEKEAPNGEI